MEKIFSTLTHTLSCLMPDNPLSVYLYGSCAADDYQPGWSDIDFICFTKTPPTKKQANFLLLMRQALCDAHQDSRFRLLEGVIVCLDEFLSGRYTRVLYYGTSGQRITTQWQMDPFSLLSLHKNGKLLLGEDIRPLLPCPTYADLVDGIRFHLHTIRTYAKETDGSLYSCGWLLDIARCLYTLRNKTIIRKTEAGKWALQQHLCPEPDQMERTLIVRKNPSEALKNPGTHDWLKTLGPSVQKFADVLEKELEEQTNEQMV